MCISFLKKREEEEEKKLRTIAAWVRCLSNKSMNSILSIFITHFNGFCFLIRLESENVHMFALSIGFKLNQFFLNLYAQRVSWKDDVSCFYCYSLACSYSRLFYGFLVGCAIDRLSCPWEKDEMSLRTRCKRNMYLCQSYTTFQGNQQTACTFQSEAKRTTVKPLHIFYEIQWEYATLNACLTPSLNRIVLLEKLFQSWATPSAHWFSANQQIKCSCFQWCFTQIVNLGWLRFQWCVSIISLPVDLINILHPIRFE